MLSDLKNVFFDDIFRQHFGGQGFLLRQKWQLNQGKQMTGSIRFAKRTSLVVFGVKKIWIDLVRSNEHTLAHGGKGPTQFSAQLRQLIPFQTLTCPSALGS
ncbi:MAG: hypothetical protein ABJN14_12655 [Paracoccaceae bacterium]